METVNCNFCKSERTDLIGPFHDLVFDQPGEFFYAHCKSCGLIYLQVRPIPQEMGIYYPPAYQPYRLAIQDERSSILRWARNRNQQRRINVVEEFSPNSPGRLLDVGCSTGIFLDAIRNKSWEVSGIEFNNKAVDYARNRFGLEVLEGQLLDASLPAGSFEVITFWDVLEHTFSPLENLKKANHLLSTGGIVIMTLPQWESFDRKIFGHKWIGYDAPRHLFIFPLPVLKAMLEATGFETLKYWSGLGGYYTFLASLRIWLHGKFGGNRLMTAMMRILEFPGIRYLFQPFFSLVDWAGRGGTRVVVARKSRDLSYP